jgi:hypothetical protein
MSAFRAALPVCMAFMLFLTCIIVAVTSGSTGEKYSTTNLFDAVIDEARHAAVSDTPLQAVRQSLPEVITKISSTSAGTTGNSHRQLQSRDCSVSGLLNTCPFGSGNNLFTGSCSNIEEKDADQWCFNGEKEVCCGMTTTDCCVVRKSFIGTIVGIVLGILLLGIILCCVFCECCPCFRYCWNSQSDEEELQAKDNAHAAMAEPSSVP